MYGVYCVSEFYLICTFVYHLSNMLLRVKRFFFPHLKIQIFKMSSPKSDQNVEPAFKKVLVCRIFVQ